MNASPEKVYRREKHPENGDFFEDIFLIPAKNASLEALKRWRKFTLVLNAARRFRYTANLKPKKFKTGTNVVVAARRFRIAGDAAAQRKDLASLDEPPIDNFRIGPKKLQHLVQHHDAAELEQLGGVSGIAKLLNTSVEKGIPNEKQEIERRRNGFGENTYPRKPYKGFFSFLWEAFQDKTLIILMICAALSLAFGIKSDGIKEGWYDGTSIAFAVILVVLVTAISDYRQSLQFQSLDEEKRNIHLDVIRGGRRFPVSIYDLVVGDVVPLNIGDQVPADGLLLAGHSLSVDESSMTGESELVHVDNKDPFLISGCKIADGYGTMVVTAVGTNTEWGQLMASISDDTTEETPLQVRLNGVATFIGKIGLIVALLVFIILTAFYFTGHTSGSKNGQKFKAGKTKADDAVNSMVDIFAIAVTIIVVAVPEGLPLAVTLTLAYSMRKMMADKALVRRLAACETMGSATAICSDKTGTLTLNQMTVVKAWVSGEMREPCVRLDMLKENIHSLLHEGISQNSTGGVYIPEEGDEVEVTGSPTEKALLSWGLQSGMDFEKARSRSQILQVETFSSEKKRAGVAVQVADSGEIHLHWKGAAEIVLSACDSWLNTEGMIVPMTEEKKEELRNTIGGMAAASLRCVAFAYRTLHREEKPDGDEWTNWKILETNLSLIAIVGIKDPCRPGVQEAVRLCQAAGVKVRMVTGDNIMTARAIAAECGILQEGDLTVEGATFRGYTPEKRIENLPKIAVMARSSPSDKLLMVKTLRELGHVVGVTGDGTNDAPALKEADIGLAMGIQGTEVAKESSDIIILDDNFSSVVNVVRWGRSVYFNIQKFVQFQLTVNVAALVINFVAAVTSGRVPLTAVQLLWVNLIMDTLGALALATEPPTNELMHKPPVGRNSPLITNIMWRNLLAQALFQVAVLLTLEFRGKQLLHLKGPNATTVKDTVIFNTFVFCQIFNEINARKPEELNIFKGILRNKMFVTIIVSEVILQIMIVEFLKKFASTTKLNWQQWLICLVIAFITWPIGFVVKFIPVPRKQVSLNLNCWRRRKGSQEKERS